LIVIQALDGTIRAAGRPMGEDGAALPGQKPTDPGRSGSDNRRFVEAVLWIVRTGSPWRDLPTIFGNWNSVFKRDRDWLKIAFVLSGRARRRRQGFVAHNASLTDGHWSMSGEVLMTLVRRSRHRV